MEVPGTHPTSTTLPLQSSTPLASPLSQRQSTHLLSHLPMEEESTEQLLTDLQSTIQFLLVLLTLRTTPTTHFRMVPLLIDLPSHHILPTTPTHNHSIPFHTDLVPQSTLQHLIPLTEDSVVVIPHPAQAMVMEGFNFVTLFINTSLENFESCLTELIYCLKSSMCVTCFNIFENAINTNNQKYCFNNNTFSYGPAPHRPSFSSYSPYNSYPQ